MRDLFLVSLCSLLVLEGACKREAPAPPTPSPVASSTTPSPPVSASSAPAAAATPALDEAAVKAFVARWQAAQNEHDFEAYQALYAARFSGVKRVGGYTKRFDRAAWLADRKPMIKPGVTVNVSDLKLSGAPGAVRAVFVQEFVAPGFRDTGTKELFLTTLTNGLAISREEMLESRVDGAAEVAKSAVLAFHRDGPVLGSGFVADAGQGAPRLLAQAAKEPYDVAVSAAPAQLSAWLGREVTVYGADGTLCKGTVKSFELRVKAEPHFGMRNVWNGEDGAPKAAPARIAQEIWNMARDEERFAVGVLDHECRGTWATGQPLAWTPTSTPTPALRAAGIAAFKALPAYRAQQTRFEKESSDTHPWETVDGELQVSEVRSSPDSALLIVSARSGASCGSFAGTLTGIWQVTGADKLTFRGPVETLSDVLRVRGAVDENADGVLELLAGPQDFDDQVSIVRTTPKGFERKVLFKTSFWDCGC